MRSRRQVPWLLSPAIALVFIGLGWKNSSDHRELREEHQKLRTRAGELGTNPDAPLQISKRSRSPRTRPDLPEIARAYIQCGKDFKNVYNEHTIRELDSASRDRIATAIEGVVSLNSSELEALIRIIRDEPGLEAHVKRNLLRFPLTRWGERDRRSLLEYLAGSPGLEDELRFYHFLMLQDNLEAWVTEAPGDVLAWMREKKEELPEKLLGTAILNYARPIVKTDPLKAFDLIEELSDQPHRFYPRIFRESPLSVADRVEVISRVRQMAGNLGDEAEKQKFLKKNLYAIIISSKRHETDFQTAAGTIAAARLDPDQIEFIWNPAIDHLGGHIKPEETGQWILWLRENIPAEQSQRRVKQLLGDWQRKDPEKAAAFVRNHPLE